ncbi:hypothetical protein VKT23_009485 [Stygiomarasmius scandens]|uniref:F-box domain-containing protein n=1 Tax=Marasmiellus scandens TaxID=2682957 RepID=A0ABR1JJ48_9AGAR
MTSTKTMTTTTIATGTRTRTEAFAIGYLPVFTTIAASSFAYSPTQTPAQSSDYLRALPAPLTSSRHHRGSFTEPEVSNVSLPDEIVLNIMELIQNEGAHSAPHARSLKTNSCHRGFSDLKSCSLVSHQWRTCAQHVLFERWTLGLDRLQLGSEFEAEYREEKRKRLQTFMTSVGPHIRFLNLSLTQKMDPGFLMARSMYPGLWTEECGEFYASDFGITVVYLLFLDYSASTNPFSSFKSLCNLQEISITPPGHEGRDLGETFEVFPKVVRDIVRSLPQDTSTSTSGFSDSASRSKSTKIIMEVPVMFYGMDVFRGRLGSIRSKSKKEAWCELGDVLLSEKQNIGLFVGVKVRNVLGVVERCESCTAKVGDGITAEESSSTIGFCKVYPKHMEEGVVEGIRELVCGWLPEQRDIFQVCSI